MVVGWFFCSTAVEAARFTTGFSILSVLLARTMVLLDATLDRLRSVLKGSDSVSQHDVSPPEFFLVSWQGLNCLRKLALGGQAMVDMGKLLGKGADVKKSSLRSYSTVALW